MPKIDTINLSRMLTTDEVAAIIKKHPVTVRRLVNRKNDPLPSRKVGGTLRYWPEEIQEWIDRQTETTSLHIQQNRSISDVLGEIAKI